MSAAPTPRRPRARPLPYDEALRRARAFDELRLERELTPAEQAEAHRLANCIYFAEWRATQRARERAIGARLAGRRP